MASPLRIEVSFYQGDYIMAETFSNKLPSSAELSVKCQGLDSVVSERVHIAGSEDLFYSTRVELRIKQVITPLSGG